MIMKNSIQLEARWLQNRGGENNTSN